jgi:hypothetical protein
LPAGFREAPPQQIRLAVLLESYGLRSVAVPA